MIPQIIAICLLLVGSAFFSGSETAFTSLSIVQIKELSEKHGRRGKLVKKLTSRADILLTTILIGNNLVNIAASALATKLALTIFGDKAVSVATGVMTLLVLIFAEVTPKRLAITYNDYISLYAARLINVFSILFRPFIIFISSFSSLLTRILQVRKRPQVSLESILHMVNIAESTGMVDTYKTRMVRNVFRFNDISIQAVMTHRTEVFSLDMATPLDTAVPQIIESGFSRIPVYSGDPEQIEGVVLARDAMKQFIQGNGGRGGTMRLREIMLEPIYVPQSKKINEMFIQFKQEKLNIAVVLDEYGGLAGIVTQEDVIEEILGDLYDEDERKEMRKVHQVKHNTYRISGDISLHQLGETLGIKLHKRKYAQTLGGYLVEAFGHIPGEGESIQLPVGTFTIESVEKNRISWVIFRPEVTENIEDQLS
jgi:CBS domain containing-hemolysin-like protein